MISNNLIIIFINILVLFSLIIFVNCYSYSYSYQNNNYNQYNNNNNYISNNNDYCSEELCGGSVHVACNNNGSISSNCPYDTKMIDLSRHKNLIVHLHNEYRNLIALGYISEYKPAAKMATMSWDNELAKLAELNVKKCIFEHDDCYNTKKFRNAGQCLAGLYYYKPDGLDINEKIHEAINIWFNEYRIIDMSYVEHFRVEKHFVFYGHFLEFVVDRNTNVGCAAIQFTDYKYPEFTRVNIACNYASIFSNEVPVYEPGQPTSKCKTGRNPKYLGLCSEKERINPNHYHEFF